MICEREGHSTQICWYNIKNRDHPQVSGGKERGDTRANKVAPFQG